MTDPVNYAGPHTHKPRRFGRGLIGWILFVGLAVLLFFGLNQSSGNFSTIPLSSFYSQVRGSNISRIAIDGDEITGVLIKPTPVGGITVTAFRTSLPPGLSGSWSFVQWLMESSPGLEVRVEPTNNLVVNFILPFIPWLLILLFIWFFVFRHLRSQSAQRQPMPVVIVNPESK